MRIISSRSSVRAINGMVATSQPLASQVGIDILKRGGNAVDAAIAIAAMLNVTEPMMTGIGGDVFALVYWSKSSEIKSLNASGRAPIALSYEALSKIGASEMPSIGMESITVPGAFDGWVKLLDEYGTMELASLLAPAIDYAEKGFPVMEKTAYDWQESASLLRKKPEGVSNYLVDGRAPVAGEIFYQKNLAKTFRLLSTGGREAFYNGEIAKTITDFFKRNGGYITMQDLTEHRSEWVEPITTTYRGYTIYECPPNGQGLTTLLALNMLENIDPILANSQPHTYYHTLIEVIKLSFEDRNKYIADPEFSQPVLDLKSKEYAINKYLQINPDTAKEMFIQEKINCKGNTTYFTVIDKDLNAVSFINSLYDFFGSGVVEGKTGIVFQNRGSAFSLNPSHLNFLQPRKRPFHTIIPAMVMKDNQLFMSFGVMGGDMQPQGQVQILSNIIDKNMELQYALDYPRFMFNIGKEVFFESEFPEYILTKLQTIGHNCIACTSYLGGAQAIIVDSINGALVGASDFRKDGLAIGY